MILTLTALRKGGYNIAQPVGIFKPPAILQITHPEVFFLIFATYGICYMNGYAVKRK